MRAARTLGYAAVAVTAALSGCSSNGISTSAGPSGGSPSTSAMGGSTPAAPTSATTDGTSSTALLGQYRTFWRTLAPASRAGSSARRALLTAVTTDPELTSLLQGIARERARGRAFYGAAIPRPTLKQFSPAQQLAVVDDCQDASASGVVQLSSGRHLTAGTAHEHVVVTMHLGSDDRWRVAFISFPKSQC